MKNLINKVDGKLLRKAFLKTVLIISIIMLFAGAMLAQSFSQQTTERIEHLNTQGFNIDAKSLSNQLDLSESQVKKVLTGKAEIIDTVTLKKFARLIYCNIIIIQDDDSRVVKLITFEKETVYKKKIKTGFLYSKTDGSVINASAYRM